MGFRHPYFFVSPKAQFEPGESAGLRPLQLKLKSNC